MTFTQEELDRMLEELAASDPDDEEEEKEEELTIFSFDQDTQIREAVLEGQLIAGPDAAFAAGGQNYIGGTYTKFSKQCFWKGEKVVIACTRDRPRSKVHCVITANEYQNLINAKVIYPQSPGYQRATEIMNYIGMKNELDAPGRAYFEQDLTIPERNEGSLNRTRDDPHLICFYRLTRNRYPSELVRVMDEFVIGDMIKKGKSRLFGTVLKIYDPSIRLSPVKQGSIFRAFGKTMQKAYRREIEAVAERIESGSASGKGSAVLLIGPDELTDAVIDAVDSVLQIPKRIIDVNQVDDVMNLKGCDRSYSGSEEGVIAATFQTYETAVITLVLKNIDRSSENGRGQRPIDFIGNMIRDRCLMDDYLDYPLPLEKTTIICTAECRDRIRIPDLSRTFDTVVVLNPMDESTKRYLAEQEVIPQLNSNPKFAGITVTETGITYLIDEYCWREGGGDIEEHLNGLFEEACRKGVREIGPEFVKDVMTKRSDPRDLHLIAYRRRRTYPPHVYQSIVNLLKDADRGDKEAPEIRQKLRRADYLIHLTGSPRASVHTPFDRSAFINQLNSTHYGLDELKIQIADCFQEAEFRDDLFSNTVLLHGRPGTGKTTIAEAIAKASGRPFIRLSLGGMIHPSLIKGDPNDPGLLADKLKNAGENPVILLDEIDKLTDLMMSTMIDLLDGSNGVRKVFNVYLDEAIDLSGALLMATANDISKITPVLLNRFQYQIHVPDYTINETVTICRDYVLPMYLRSLSGYHGTVTFEPGVLEMIARRHAMDSGIRRAAADIKAIVRNRIAKAASPWEDIRITEADVQKDHEESEMPVFDLIPGMANGVAVLSDGSGSLMQMKAVLLDGEGDTIVTGLADQMAKESVQNGVTYLRANFAPEMNKRYFHVHFNDSSIDKRGPSGGLPILMAMLSAMFGTKLSETSCFTGEIDPLGYVLPVGGVDRKIEAAVECGITSIYVPKANRKELKELSVRGINVIPVEHVREVMKREFALDQETERPVRARTA